MKEMERVEMERQQLRDELESLNTKIEEQGEEMENMHKRHEESNRSLQSELMKKDKNIKALEIKMNTLKTKMENKTKSHEECLRENKNLKRQITTDSDNYSHFEIEVNELKEEFKNVQALHDEELKQLHQEIETKKIVEAELHAKVQQLQLIAAEAVRSKEDIEMKCQHKISDMVALMDKHKNQYDKMVEEKDAELDERRRKEADIKAEKTSLELELSELKIENSHLKQELENGLKDKENMKEEISALNKKMKSLKKDNQQETPAERCKGLMCPSSPKALSSKSRGAVFDFSNEEENETLSKTPSWCTVKKVMVTPQLKESETATLKTPSRSTGNKVAPRIKSYRIRTPPSPGKSVLLGRNALELDPKSESSEQHDTLSFTVEPDSFEKHLTPCVSGTVHQHGIQHKKLQSPAVAKSPGTALKLAAVKRMRDAGWTAVTNADKRKKGATEKIFA
ncbi:hypothetical protein MATL_G00073460 [Megalops atlanticus]|uniref:Synaptonemal complex protein 1 n=1 Tax=Megalops atlanticus TaxID=7932 RepID=A0A9D3TGE3_MEGAT|nr:hypothetical protein MATL_G00073460 [Megalops atlanticus]